MFNLIFLGSINRSICPTRKSNILEDESLNPVFVLVSSLPSPEIYVTTNLQSICLPAPP
nr:MAG TPA: hypothetical protein [Caudoviricetes sp.]